VRPRIVFGNAQHGIEEVMLVIDPFPCFMLVMIAGVMQSQLNLVMIL